MNSLTEGITIDILSNTKREQKARFVNTQNDVMDGKHVIVIGGGSYRSMSKWLEAASYGIKVILVDIEDNHPSRDIVRCYVCYDFSDHTMDHTHACKIIQLIQDQEMVADCCVTFYDECAPLTALICDQLGFKGISYKAAMIANSKTETHDILGLHVDKYQTKAFSTKSYHLTKEEDCKLLPQSFKFPAILKLDNGVSAVGTCIVESRAAMKSKFQQITSTLRNDSDFQGIALCLGNSLTTMEFHCGTEHIIDLIVYDGKIICAFISDNGVVRRPFFIATARRIPTFLSSEQQTMLIDAAFRCCLAIGLKDGIFNVDMMLTDYGPKVLEINTRIGGYVLTNWLKKLYGVDIMLYSMMIACSIKPKVPDLCANKMMMGVMLIPSLHSHLQTDDHFKSKLCKMIEDEEVIFVQFRRVLKVSGPYERPFGNIGVSGSSSTETKLKLINVCRVLAIHQDEYNVEKFIENF